MTGHEKIAPRATLAHYRVAAAMLFQVAKDWSEDTGGLCNVGTHRGAADMGWRSHQGLAREIGEVGV